MVTIELDPSKEQRLRELADNSGQNVNDLAKRILEDFLDLQAWKADTAEAWAEASVALAREVMEPENWHLSGEGDGSR